MRAIERIAARAVAERAAALAEALGAVPGVGVERDGSDVVLSGRRLAERAVVERALRDPAGLLQ